MTTHGSVNHGLWRPINTNQYQFYFKYADMFVATYRFLNSTLGASLGIVRRACNFNNGTSDCDYAQRPGSTPPGENAWVLFEFTSASPKFWLLLQQSSSTSNSNFGQSPGNPGSVDWINSTAVSAFAFAAAVREDGGNPWNGTSANNGLDTKGIPVWVPGPSRLAMAPLNNGFRGQFRVDRSAMHSVCQAINYNADRTRREIFHVVATEDSITFLPGHDGGTYYDFSYFGKYNPINPTGASYCFISTFSNSLTPFNTAYFDMLWPWAGGGGIYGIHQFGSNMQGATYAGTNSSSGNNYYWSGGIIDRVNFAMVPIGLGHMMQMEYYAEYDRLIATNRALGKMDVFNIPVFIDGRARGPVGELSNIKICHTLPNHATIHRRKYAVFGRPRNEGKVLTLWGGDVVPGQLGSVFGVQF